MAHRLTALTLLLLALPATAGTHIGNLHLKLHDDNTPVVAMDPTRSPRLALWTCGQQTPTILDAVGNTSGTWFELPAEVGTVCKVGLDLGSPVDLKVAGVYTATADPVPEAFTVNPIDVSALAGGTIRVGTATMMTNLRAIAAVPRTATSSEEAAISAALSVTTLQLP